ncbi:MAG TPA: Fic family protein [Candidatus Acidoferrales bacterium]
MAENPLLCPPDQKQTLEISNQAAVVDFLADFVKTGRKRITESDLLAIHFLTIRNIYPCAGKYRTALNQIEITDSTHTPSAPSQVILDTRDMLDWLERAGREQSPVHRATYLLWKTNAIHPFSGGNGRTARALAYLLILIEIAPIFAGESLPSKLRARKADYIAGLKAADRGSLFLLESLVQDCLREQIDEARRLFGA